MRPIILTLRCLCHEQRIFWRNRPAVFFTIGLPTILLLIFGTLNGDNALVDFGGQPFAQFFVPGMIAFGLLSTCYGNLASRFVYKRESGLLLRMRATPLPVGCYVAALLANAVLVTAMLAAALLVTGRLAYQVGVADRWPWLVITLFVGAVSSCALGLVLPTRHIVEGTVSSFDERVTGEGFDVSHLAIVAAWGVAAVLVTVKRFRWEPSRQ